MRIYWDCGRFVSELYTILFLFRLVLLMPKHPKYVICSIGILSILYVSFMHSGNHRSFDIIMAAAASRYSSHRKISLIYWISMLTAILGSLFFWKLGLASEVVKHIGNSVGHSYGISNPNVLAELYMCVLLAALLYFKINRFRDILIYCWSFAIIVWLITLCRSVTLALFMFPFFYYCFRRKDFAKGLVYWPILMLVVSILLALYFGPVLGDTTLISRFSIPYYVYEQTGLSWFGTTYYQNSGIYIDSYLLHHFLNHGIITGLILMVFYSCLLHRMSKRKNHPLLVCMICCVTLFGFLSIMPLDIRRDFMLLFFFNDEEEVG